MNNRGSRPAKGRAGKGADHTVELPSRRTLVIIPTYT